MKYTNEIAVDLPLKRTVELFDNPDNMKYWMPGLLSFETYEGKAGKPGAKSKLRFKMGKREMEMIETIEESNFPENFVGTYEAPGVWNRQVNRFEAIDENTTRYISESEFKFQTLSMKIFGWLMPGAFKKQSQKYLEHFKDFAENAEERMAAE